MADNQHPGNGGQNNNASGGIGGRTGPNYAQPSNNRDEAPQSQVKPINCDTLGQAPGKEAERRPIQRNWTDGSGKL